MKRLKWTLAVASAFALVGCASGTSPSLTERAVDERPDSRPKPSEALTTAERIEIQRLSGLEVHAFSQRLSRFIALRINGMQLRLVDSWIDALDAEFEINCTDICNVKERQR